MGNQNNAKLALVTGGSQRLGRELGIFLAKQGWNIALHYRSSQAAAEETAEKIRDYGQQCYLMEADFATATGIHDLLDQAKDLPTIDLLINNAAIFQQDTLATVTVENLHKHYQTNLIAPALLSRLVQQGQIIHLLDAKVQRVSPGFLSYTLSKAALAALVEISALELAPNVRVNAIAPGPVIPAPTQRQSHFDDMQGRAPLGKGATIDTICSALQYLLSADTVTGQTLTIDGGATVGNGGFPASC